MYYDLHCFSKYSKTYVKRPLSKRPQIGFQDQLLLNAGQKYCRMLQGEHSAKLSTIIKLPFVSKIFICLFLNGHFTQVLLYILRSLQYQGGQSHGQHDWVHRFPEPVKPFIAFVILSQISWDEVH